MKKHHPDNERIKKRYLDFEKEARRQSEATIDTIAKSLSRFEEYTQWRDFRKFHYRQAIAFKENLGRQKNLATGKPLSKSTMAMTLAHLRRFFQWLCQQPGYKRLDYLDAEYFNLSDKDLRVASAKRPKKVPTIEQIRHVIDQMPNSSEIERRNLALIAFTLLTGARDAAVASFSLKHIDVDGRCVFQDAREVKTKFSKSFSTFFFPVGGPFEEIVGSWVAYLRNELFWGHDDPLFPATLVEVGETKEFQAKGLKREHWRTTSPIRSIFKQAFEAAGLPYFPPHSFRDTLVQLGERICRTPEEFKAWSQNLGHEDVITTFTSYGEVPVHRQGEILGKIGGSVSHDRGEDIIGQIRLLVEEKD